MRIALAHVNTLQAKTNRKCMQMKQEGDLLEAEQHLTCLAKSEKMNSEEINS